MACDETLQFVEHCRKHNLAMGIMVVVEPEGNDWPIEKIADGFENFVSRFTGACGGITPLVIPMVQEEFAGNPHTDIFVKAHPIDDLEKVRSENTDINLLLHRDVGRGDLIIVRKDGTVTLNGKPQGECQMELM